MTRTIPVDIGGLNLILGGGVPLLKRHQDFDESATILIRGPAGSGKTIFGTQLAGSLARSLGCEVAYGCLELLPTELAAQHAGVKREGVSERVVVSPFLTGAPTSGECRIFAAVLDLGEPGEESTQLDHAVVGLLDTIAEHGGQPRVLVIDSLSDGYNLGLTAPRALADGLCKLAVQRGMVLILLEEAVDERPSPWSFATDMVIQLGPHRRDAPDSLERPITIPKNRLGPSDSSIHHFAIVPHVGIRLLPHPSAYLLWDEGKHFLQKTESSGRSWGPLGFPSQWPPIEDCTIAIYGPEAHTTFQTAISLGATGSATSDLLIDFQSALGDYAKLEESTGELRKIGFGNPYLNGSWLLSEAVEALKDLHAKSGAIRRVLIGDLRSLRSFKNPAELRNGLAVLSALLRRARIPVILYETCAPTEKRADNNGPYETAGEPGPEIADFADVIVNIWFAHQERRGPVFATHARSGQRIRLP